MAVNGLAWGKLVPLIGSELLKAINEKALS